MARAASNAEIRSLAQPARQRVVRRQGLERGQQLGDFAFGHAEADAPAELVQHIDATAPVGRIHHQMHRSVRLEYAPQGAQAGSRVG